MRRLVYSMMVSLDGFAAGPDGGLDWITIDEEFHSFANEEARQSGVFLYGRRLYELMAGFWPTADAIPAAPQYIVEFARIWKEKPKVVFSSTLEKVDWNSRLVRGNVAEEIIKLKEQPGEVLSIGGPGIASVAMRLGLIDEYRLLVHPVVLGAGLPFFPDLAHRIPLRFLETRTFRSGVVYLRYEKAGG